MTRYKNPLAGAVQTVVHGGHAPEREHLATLAGGQVPQEDLDPFVQTALVLLLAVKEEDESGGAQGRVANFVGLSPSGDGPITTTG